MTTSQKYAIKNWKTGKYWDIDIKYPQKDFIPFGVLSYGYRHMTEENNILRIFEPFIFGKCRCGCNIDIPIYDKRWKRLRRYVNGGHWQKGKISNGFKGGKKLHKGYVYLFKPDYFSSEKSGYVTEHVFLFQEFHKCCMLPWGDIHHLNKIKNDNRIENIQGLVNGNHTRIHTKKDMSGRKCSNINCKTPYRTWTDKNGYPHWYRDGKNGFLCQICYRRKRKVI